MRIIKTLTVLLLFVAWSHAEEIKWETDFERARERSVKEGKLLFIDFDADW